MNHHPPKKGLIITIDGPAGSGKSTTAKRVAAALRYLYLDTGAMYRAVTLEVIREGIKEPDKHLVSDLIRKIDVTLKNENNSLVVLLNGEDVSGLIRTPEIDFEISWVCQIPAVREQMVALQRKLGQAGNVVAEGRDMGTVVFPDADLKFFMIASVAERAQRRWLQMNENGINISVDQIKTDLIRRDQIDSQRELSPLQKTADAIEIDTSRLTIDQQTELILNHVSEVMTKINQ